MRALLTISSLAATAFAGAAMAADAPGKPVFDQWCAGCHAPIAARIGFAPPAGTYTLGKRYGETKPAALEARTDLSAALVKSMVRNGIGMMPPSRKTEISDAQLEQLAAYLSKSNR